MCESILPAFCGCFPRSNNQQKRERERERERDDDDTGGFSSVLLRSIFQFQNKSALQISYVSTLAFTLCYVLLLPSLD